MRARHPLALLAVALTFGAGARVGSGAPEGLAARALDRATVGLSDVDRGMRYASVVALGKGGAPAERLAPALADAEACVRLEAAWWLRRTGPSGLATIERTLTNGSVPERAAVAWALSGFGSDGLPLLARALDDVAMEVRVEAVAAVRRLGPLVAASLRRAVERACERGDGASLDGSEPSPPTDNVATPERLAAEAILDELDDECDATLAAFDAPLRTPVPRADSAPVPRPSKPTTTGRAPTPPTPSLPPDPALAPRHFPALDRIDAVLALGASQHDLPALDAAMLDPERDVRLAAILALGRSRLDAGPRLLRALDDANARVRRAALSAIGRHNPPPERLATFLDDPTLPTSTTAREALRELGVTAAPAVARQMVRGGYAALHHGRILFEAWGPAAGAAAPILGELLRHDDVNVREDAARSLVAIGPAAAPAAPALLFALRDARLCVISHAAVALGRIGLSEPLLDALDDPSARVRSYAMWAVAWALGETRGVAQVPFEMRLPVLDVGETGPTPSADDVAVAVASGLASPTVAAPGAAERRAVLRRALRSRDREVAVPAAAALTYEDVDAVEAERVMELLLPEGLRHDSPVDFDELRRFLGTTELPACLLYAARSRHLPMERLSIYRELHRLPRADTLPFLAWFETVEEPEVLEDVGWLWMPADRTLRFPDASRYEPKLPPGASNADAARTALRNFVKDPSIGLGGPALWAVRDWMPTPGDAPLIHRALDLADGRTRINEPHDGPATRWVLLLALGRLDDDATRARVREVLEEAPAPVHDTGVIAIATLARLGDAAAMDDLIARSRDSAAAFALLASLAPRRAARVLSSRLLYETDPLRRANAIRHASEAVEHAFAYGVLVPPETWLGIEMEILHVAIDPLSLWRIVATVPGLHTRRLAARLLERLETDAPLVHADAGPMGATEWGFDDVRAAVASLFTADAPRTTALLRDWAFAGPSPQHPPAETARELLAVLRDESSRAVYFSTPLAPWIDLWDLTGWPGPETLGVLWARIDQPGRDAKDRNKDLESVAQLLGWPRSDAWFLDSLEPEDLETAIAALRRGDLDAVRAFHPDPDALLAPNESRVLGRLGQQAAAGQREARRALWSALRAGRREWIDSHFQERLDPFLYGPATLPHWVEELDSNCCRVGGGLESTAFEGNHGVPDLYNRHREGIGGPASAFVVEWMAHHAADWVENPLADDNASWSFPRFLPAPE